jgi:hypothetical protein
MRPNTRRMKIPPPRAGRKRGLVQRSQKKHGQTAGEEKQNKQDIQM